MLRSDDDRDACLRLLTSSENKTLCQGIYTHQHINIVLENSTHILFRNEKSNINKIAAFGLVQILKKKLDIHLVCTIPNTERFGNMMAFDIYSFAVKKGLTRIYTAPRTEELRSTFMKYGFEHFRGIKNIDEVLEKKVVVTAIERTNKTRKQSHTKTTPIQKYTNNYPTVTNLM